MLKLLYIICLFILMISANVLAVEKPQAEQSPIKFKVMAYQGHNDGTGCNTDLAQPSLKLIDEDKDRKEAITFCLKINNLTKFTLSNITLHGIKPELIHTDFNILSDKPVKFITPYASLTYYYEYLLEDSLDAKFTVEVSLLDKQGLALTKKAIQQTATSKAELILAPPIVHKTVLPRGGKGMLWTLELVNNVNKQNIAVGIFDNIPEHTLFEPLKTGDFVSESGVYCEAQGESITDICTLETIGADHPARIIWKGKIAPDFARTTEDANNKVIIRFQTSAPDAKVGDIITSQARSLWGDEQIEILSDNPDTPKIADTTQYKIHKPIEPESKAIQIPTLSQWGIILLVLFVGIVGVSLRLLSNIFKNNMFY